jgi:hypothetical protein
MKKILFLSALCFLGCNNSNQITITKVEGSTIYDNAKLSLKASQTTEAGHLFSLFGELQTWYTIPERFRLPACKFRKGATHSFHHKQWTLFRKIHNGVCS